MRRLLTIAILGVATLSSASAQEDGAPVARGTAGLVAVPFSAGNDTAVPIGCAATLAHWYSLDLGRAAPRDSVTATLWSDPKDGNLFLLNPTGDRMPVLSLSCGPEGQVWSAGTRIGIERRAGRVPPPQALRCRQDRDRIACS